MNDEYVFCEQLVSFLCFGLYLPLHDLTIVMKLKNQTNNYFLGVDISFI